MPIVFTSTPLPANGQPRTAASEAAIFSNIANTYNTYETAVNSSLSGINAILALRGSTAVAGNIAQRDGNGDIFFRDTYGRSFVGSGIFYGGPLAKAFTDINGFIRADALPLAIPSYLTDNIQPGVNSTALTVTWGSGFVTDATGNAHQVTSGFTSLVGTMPNPTTQANWGLLYADKTTGVVSFVWALATNSITPSVTLPANAWAIMDVYAPANAAGPIVPKAAWTGGTQAFFVDARYRNSGPPAVGGGGGGSPVSFGSIIAPLSTTDAGMLAQTGVTTPFNFAEWVNASAPNVVRNGINPSLLRLKESMIAFDSTQGTLEDANSLSVTGNLDGAIILGTNSITVKVPGGQPPITFKSGGKRLTQKDTDNGSAGYTTNTVAVIDVTYTLYANLQSGTIAYTLASSPPVGNYIPLKDYLWDGSVFYMERDRVKPTINSHNLQKDFKSMLYPDVLFPTPTGTGGAILPIVTGTAGMLTFQLPTGNWRAQCRATARLQLGGAVGTTPDMRFYVMNSTGKGVALSGGAFDLAQKAPPIASSIDTMKFGGLFENLSGGYQNFGIGHYLVIAGSPGAYNYFSPYLEVEISRM